MKNDQDYIQDIAEIRSMMERSSKFLSLSGWAGIFAGIYALTGAWIAYSILNFHPDEIFFTSADLPGVILLALGILILSLLTAIYFSRRKAEKRGEKIWNTISKRLVVSLTIPLLAGAILILILMSKGLIGLMAPMTLLFYGLALYNAGQFTFHEVKILGIIQIFLGLLNVWFIDAGLLFWAVGFGLVHIVYGIYMHYRYER